MPKLPSKKKKPQNVMTIRPARRGGGGRSPIPGKWISINRNNGTVSFSAEITEVCMWIRPPSKLLIDYDDVKGTLRFYLGDDGFKVRARKSGQRITGYGLTAKPLSEIEFPDGIFNLKGGTSARFNARTLSKSVVCVLTPREA